MPDWLQKIAESIATGLAGLIVPAVLEWIKKKQSTTTPIPTPALNHNPAHTAFAWLQPWIHLVSVSVRLLLSLQSGFFASIVLSVLLENMWHTPTIEPFTAFANVLMILCTLITWFFLSLFGPLKVHA
ncbi:MAG: hypothetical protein WA231_15315 [Methylocella sp.]